MNLVVEQSKAYPTLASLQICMPYDRMGGITGYDNLA